MPEATRACRYCLRPIARDPRGDPRFCSYECMKASDAERKIGPPVKVTDCELCEKPFARMAGRRHPYCSAACATVARRERERRRDPRQRSAHGRNQSHRRRAAMRTSDLRNADIEALLNSRTYCPLCRKKMTDDHWHPHAKHIDHVIPLCIGGTHTMGNVRVICRTCNLQRPKDGSDVAGQVTLWAQDQAAAPSVDDVAMRDMARKQRADQRERVKQERRQARYERLAGRAAIALGLRLQGNSWHDVALGAGYSCAVSARSSVIHHWPSAEVDILNITKDIGKAKSIRRYVEITARRDQGQPWARIADELGYANVHSARRCYRRFREVAGGQLSVRATQTDTPQSSFPRPLDFGSKWPPR